MKSGVKVLACVCLILLVPALEGAQKDDSASEARQLLSRFVGKWVGEGTARDEARWEWTLDDRFLRLGYRELAQPGFKAEGYLWYNPQEDRFELYEFNNGARPVRFFAGAPLKKTPVGKRGRQTIVLEEHADHRHIRLTIEWLDESSWNYVEANLHDGEVAPFVQMTFRPAPAK